MLYLEKNQWTDHKVYDLSLYPHRRMEIKPNIDVDK